MFDKKILYQLIDNKYNNNKINISLTLTDVNYVKNYLTLISNALKYNYKKYNNIITKLSIQDYPQGNTYIINYRIQNNIFNYFSLNNNLIDITINNHLIDNNNLEILCSSLKNNINLKILNLSHNEITDITPLKDVLNNNTIKKIDLSWNNITYITSLKDVLKNNTSLKILNLTCNTITDITPLKDVLKNNNSLQELYIDNPHCIINYESNNKIISCGDYNLFITSGNMLYSVNQQYDNNNSNNYQSDLSNIFNILKNNNTLKKLNLRDFILNDLEYYSLCDMLKVNTSINSFTITNTINKSADFNHDCSKLFNILKFNNSIQDLTINIYKMNKKEVKSLSEMLKFNTSLKKLTINKNYTSYNDLILIYKSLEFNKNIKELIIVNNLLTINETDRRYDLNLLCKCLYFNKSITRIFITDNIIKDIDLIVDLLKYNHHITNIDFFECAFNGRNYDINIVDNLKDKIKTMTNFNKTLYNDF